MKMAILQTCCCWNTVRRGSYASAGYTLVYYLGCSIVMGITIYHDLEYYWSDKENEKSSKPKNVSFLEPSGISKFTMMCFLMLFVLSVFGLLSSILLWIGLHLEIRMFLIPWMIIVLICSVLEIFHSVYWLILGDPDFSPVTAMLLTTEIFIFLINIYALLCVYSQYQEYKAGRGTAAYDVLQETLRKRDQVPSLNVRSSQPQATATSYLTGTTTSNSTRESTPIVLDTLKTRRIQLTGEEESMITQSSSKSRFGSFLVPPDRTRDTKITNFKEEVDDYGSGRSN